MNAAEKEGEAIRDRIQNWLMGEGWEIADQPHPDFTWLIRAQDAGGRRILLGQSKMRPDRIHLEARVDIAGEHRRKFDSLPEGKRRENLWKLRFRLLMMGVDFMGVAEPMQSVVLTQRIYVDDLNKDSFIQRFLVVRNAVIAVIWSVIEDLEGVEAPADSVEQKAH
jgi:hypothetical protein